MSLSRHGCVGIVVGCLVLALGAVRAAEEAEPTATTVDPAVSVEELGLLVKPLTTDELVVEADAWLGSLRAKVSRISRREIEVRRQGERISKVEGEPQAETQKVVQTAVVESLTDLRAERTAIIDRLNVVLDELELKGGDAAAYRKYAKAVSGVDIDVTDTNATWTTVTGWLRSEQGGLRWAKNLALFVATLLAFWVLSVIVGGAVDRATGAASNMSALLRSFLGKTVRRVVLLLGIVVAISALEINVNPLLAAIGGAAFVIALALQGTLSNFASGMLILAYRPFDVGDVIDAGGVSGKVDSMNLTSTHVRTPDNKVMIVPNNKIWGDVITNATGSDTRRVDLVFGIGYGDDIAKAQGILEEILRRDTRVLSDPEPVVRLHELGDSSVNFVCRPWVKTADYWAVYWDVTRAVKEEFDRQGVSIPFPQRDVHVYQEGPPLRIADRPLAPQPRQESGH